MSLTIIAIIILLIGVFFYFGFVSKKKRNDKR